jgi:hypothetical protein
MPVCGLQLFTVPLFFPFLSLSVWLGWYRKNNERKENFTVDDFNEHNYSMLHFGAGLHRHPGCLVFGWTHTLGRAFWRRSRPDNVFFLFVSSRSHHL